MRKMHYKVCTVRKNMHMLGGVQVKIHMHFHLGRWEKSFVVPCNPGVGQDKNTGGVGEKYQKENWCVFASLVNPIRFNGT